MGKIAPPREPGRGRFCSGNGLAGGPIRIVRIGFERLVGAIDPNIWEGVLATFTVTSTADDGSAGTLHVGWKESRFRRASDGAWTVFGGGYDKVQSFCSQLDNFVRSIRGEEPPLITLVDALASVEVIDAAYEALWRAAWVPIASHLSRSLAAA